MPDAFVAVHVDAHPWLGKVRECKVVAWAVHRVGQGMGFDVVGRTVRLPVRPVGWSVGVDGHAAGVAGNRVVAQSAGPMVVLVEVACGPTLVVSIVGVLTEAAITQPNTTLALIALAASVAIAASRCMRVDG